jgi:acyl-coenzyme A synthetase/AMP-(fatty) acid ligase
MNTTKTGSETPLTPLPCTVTYIGYHAAGRPDAPALIINGRTVTYRAFYGDIARMVKALRGLGLAPGQIVAVEHPHFYLHWLILLACEALSVISCSYEQVEVPVLEKALSMVDLVLCREGEAPPNAGRVHIVDQTWADEVLALTPDLPIETAPVNPDTPVRIVKSSGTTGSFKCMMQPWKFREHYLEGYQFRAGFNRDSRFLVTMGLVVEPFNIYASNCVRMGGVCIYDSREGIAENLSKQAITHLVVPPYILMQLLENLPANYEKAANLIVITIGAAVSKEIRDRVKRDFADDLIESYGAQEIGVVATMNENGMGALLPGVEAEVVDEEDRPIIGEAGRVRVKANVSVGGYIDDSDATAAMFQGDWFYPGDLAVMPDRYSLQLIGRVDDTLNIQGIKFAPGPLEEKLRNNLGVEDLCLSALADSEGNNRLCVVVVLQKTGCLEDIQSALPSLIPGSFGKVHIIAVQAIPRTATSKVRRAELKAMLEQSQS